MVYSQKFKQASIGLLLNIIKSVSNKNSHKYYNFFQKELNITPEEFQDILELQEFTKAHNIVLENEIEIVMEELEHKRHQIMKFLMMLNRCIIIDGCSVECYQRFEKVRDNFLKKI